MHGGVSTNVIRLDTNESLSRRNLLGHPLSAATTLPGTIDLSPTFPLLIGMVLVFAKILGVLVGLGVAWIACVFIWRRVFGFR